MLGIVVSRADEASTHIGDRVLALADWSTHEDHTRLASAGGGVVHRTGGAELRTFDDLHIELDRPDEPFDEATLLAFVSRHSGDTGPLLTAHHTGNYGPADFGGTPGQLAVAAPRALKVVLETLERHAPAGYDVGLECTHHGPTELGVPSLFVEVGSDEAQWQDEAAATAAAQAVLALRGVAPQSPRAFVGFGGGHYAPRFTRIVRETDWAVGHIAADWSLDAMGERTATMIPQVFDRCGAHLGVIDGDRPGLASVIEERGYRVVGETWLRETSGVDLATVEQFEESMCPVDAGLRFGNAARDDVPRRDYTVVTPPPELLADANGGGPDRIRAAIDAHAIAYETVEAGTRVAGRIGVPEKMAWERIETALVGILRERFDQVLVADDEIVVEERRFDPERARALGVEPGPAFGRLAGGEPVVVGDERIDPEAVFVTRIRRYPRIRA